PAIFTFAIGLLLAAIQLLARPWVIALIAGVIVCAVGVGWLMANNPSNKKTGALITALGVTVMLSRTPLKPLTVVMATVLNIATIGFLVIGVKNLIAYLVAQGKRY
ncbi:MAG: hypothetical protein LBQ69_04755, partial [Treponema sp.]|nr:hypothetical protein [Treponema sp.]